MSPNLIMPSLFSLVALCAAVTVSYDALRPVHTGDYSRLKRRQFVAEFGNCCRIRQQSPKSETIAASVDCGQGFNGGATHCKH